MKTYSILFICLFLSSYLGYSQGCSDAGFCTMGAMKPDQKFNKKSAIRLRSVEISQYYGLTKFDDHIFATNLDMNVGLSKNSTLQVKLPYQFVSGPLANTSGVGDISLSFTQGIINTENLKFAVTIGGKIPTNNGNKTRTHYNVTTQKNEELPLPMYYQTSLGSYDLILGASIITKKWLFGVGYQQVLGNENQNAFLWGKWRTSAPELRSSSDTYPVSKNVVRGTDIMLRIERNFRFSNYNFNVGLLPIYRLNKDITNSIVEDPITKIKTEIRGEMAGTDGLALSGLFGGGYNFSVNSGIKFMCGVNLLELVGKSYRKNPDGLSRELVITCGYEFRF